MELELEFLNYTINHKNNLDTSQASTHTLHSHFKTLKMLFKSLLFAACAVASASCTTHGTFKPPKSESFVTIELYLDRSVNLTTLDGAAALVPCRGGEIKGQFNGFVVQNLTASTERVKFDSKGGEYSVCSILFDQFPPCSSQLVNICNLTGSRLMRILCSGRTTMVSVSRLLSRAWPPMATTPCMDSAMCKSTTNISRRRALINIYFSPARTLETTIPELEWINYAMFIAEWQADFFSGIGETEIFEVNTSGRRDGQPIPALEPPTTSSSAESTPAPTPQ